MIRVKIVGISPDYSGIWNYGHFLEKYLSKNKNLDVEFVNLWKEEKYHNDVTRAISLLKGIEIEDCHFLLLISPLLCKSFSKSTADVKATIVHDLYPINHKDSLPVKILAKLIYKKMNDATILFPITEFTKKDIIKEYSPYNENDRLIVINGGIDHSVFKYLNDKENIRKKHYLPNGKLFIHVGREDPRKNFKFVLELFNKIKIKDKKLIKVGGITPEEWIYIDENNMEKDIIQFRDIDNQTLCELYNASDMLLFPSTYEGLGLPPIEAMACGCPVIAANNTGLTEVCLKESLTELDEKKWLKKINEFMDNGIIAHKGLEQAKKFDWEKYCETLSEWIELLGRQEEIEL